MNPLIIAYLVVSGLALLALPRRWGVLPILVTACYMTRVGVELGPLHFTVLRILLCVGLVRITVRGERTAGGMNGLDWWMAAWGLWLLVSVAFHRNPGEQAITRLGNALDAGGLYLLFRVFCGTRDEIVSVLRIIPLLLVPLAFLMLFEKASAHNLFAVLGGVPDTPVIRGGKVRAQGPFNVSILAGTVAAGCIPLILGLWWADRKRVLIGLAASVAIIYACTSSGPIMTAAWGIAALLLWPLRHHMRLMRWSAVAAYIALAQVMQDPPYFLMARIDLTGSSTGWHRAEIIKSALAHLSEWWIVGTDRTIHWMPYGLTGSADHTDITNHYLNMGVLGGLPLMLLFIAVMACAFSMVGKALRHTEEPTSRWIVWALGASLFSHAVTFLSISYFDQSMVFLYLDLAMAACLTVRAEVTAASRDVAPTAGRAAAGFVRQAIPSPGRRRPASIVTGPIDVGRSAAVTRRSAQLISGGSRADIGRRFRC